MDYCKQKDVWICVKITQVLYFNFTAIGNYKKTVNSKLKLVKCPKIVHTLEMKFNDLENFNEKFTALGHLHCGVEDLIIDNMPDKTIKTNFGISSIETKIENC